MSRLYIITPFFSFFHQSILTRRTPASAFIIAFPLDAYYRLRLHIDYIISLLSPLMRHSSFTTLSYRLSEDCMPAHFIVVLRVEFPQITIVVIIGVIIRDVGFLSL